ncbi:MULTISPECIES: GNAT family N-acetyltransferase [unclassified Streptomyces]|uniref:GNAT family N-acetyltransferase n=1 Tax=unclassified Streptomyces TaxID=2593676 RepID=UPI000DC76D9E|nr:MULTISPECIES: GNAT family N-acetyltransferase [unclassified Streptomyces]AWZ08710.1 molybdopterin-guanine dinucleotide biosynthesis protein MobC [Streptomyces sp. ICC4]AWZ16497.1 molybdopterin-guanine dinucleotide biosynthesis protein MobC [Streptomyces sp. ICC1]
MGTDTTDTGAGPVTVRRGLPAGAERRAAEMYWAAFGRKLGPALNPPDKAVPFIAAHLNADRAVCAILDGQLVGLAGYQLGGRALTGGSASAVLRVYGHLRGLPRLLLLALFERHPAPGQLVMDGIAVDPGIRGRGVGSLLIEEVAAVAAEQHCREIRLDVIDTNPRARALYERRGFTAVGTERTPYLRGLLGFGAVTTMRRTVGTRGAKEL